MTEADLQRDILLACSRGPIRLFRQNTGVGWVGRIVAQTPKLITLEHYRPLHAGLCKGSSDLIGWDARDGRFCAIEVKRPGQATTMEQNAFLFAVQSAHGRQGVARSVFDAQSILGLNDIMATEL